MLSYYEICELIKGGATVKTSEDEKVPYLISRSQWVGYDDEVSLREKVRFMKSNGYGGVMIWTYDFDDFKGHFCGKGNYPLLNAIKNECSN